MKTSNFKNLIKEVVRTILESHYEGDVRDPQGRVSRPDISYDVEQKKGQVSKIIANLQSHSSGAFTKVVEKLLSIERLENEIEALKEEVKQEGVREKISALFGAEYQYVTRTVKLVSLIELTMSKDPVAATTVKWADVYQELYEELPDELKSVGDDIVKKFSTKQDPKPPSLKINKPEMPTEEIGGSEWSSFENKVKSWGNNFNDKLNHVIDTFLQNGGE